MYRYTKYDDKLRYALTPMEKGCLVLVLEQIAQIRPKMEMFWIRPFILHLHPLYNTHRNYLHHREARLSRLAILIFGGPEFVKPKCGVLRVNLLEKLDFMLNKKNYKRDTV